jgi:xanthine dehydrogenase small subunit
MLQLMLNAEVVNISTNQADGMLLPYLREQRFLTGTKEGCASGDCGACTVVLVDKETDETLRYRQINACITPLHALHGKQIITVEHLKQGDKLHPVQQMVVDRNGTQCGFCTPGIVMSLYALSKQSVTPSEPTDYLAGNLCRCTGYGPLIECANDIAATPVNDPIQTNKDHLIAWMNSVSPLHHPNYFTPTNRDDLGQLRRQYPNATLVSGATDLALDVTQRYQNIEQMIDLSNVDDLLTIEPTELGWRIGAAVPMYRVHEFMRQHYPTTNEIIQRLGSLTIRHRATLGGSLGHASPIGDIAPLLISLGGKIELDNGREKSVYSPEEYIVDYRKTVIQPDQWISAIHIPLLTDKQKHAIYKVSKRYEDDIATVVLALNMTINEQGVVEACLISAGGVAAKSVRLTGLEDLLIGQVFNQANVNRVKQHVANEITPMSDVRGSAEYRIKLVENLIQRYFFETQHIETRLVHHA